MGHSIDDYKKKRDFGKFRKLARLLQEGKHLSSDGIREILRVRRDMNDGGKRRYTEEEILTALLPTNISIQIFKALLENAASEHGARMTAMDNATRNAGDMISSLTLVYNRTRQAAITGELIEIISAKEAM